MRMTSRQKIRSVAQPSWCCTDCGEKFGKWYRHFPGETPETKYIGPHHCATYSVGKCDVCKREVEVTEARDFGYLNEGWIAASRKRKLKGTLANKQEPV